MKTFDITFKTTGKYPQKRKVTIVTSDRENAERLVHQRFGSFKLKESSELNGALGVAYKGWIPTNKIKIMKVKEIL